VPGHALINQVARQTTRDEIGGKLAHVLAERLRITRAQAARRIDEAEDLGTRQAVTGEPLPPCRPAVSAAQRAGAIGVGHVSVIRRFLRELPCWVDIETRSQAEVQLAACADNFGLTRSPSLPTNPPIASTRTATSPTNIALGGVD